MSRLASCRVLMDMALALAAIATGCSQAFEVGSMASGGDGLAVALTTAGATSGGVPATGAAAAFAGTTSRSAGKAAGGDSRVGGDAGGTGAGSNNGNSSGGTAGALPSCNDALQNGSETDVDCGGPCAPCANGLACTLDQDCASAACISALCGPSRPSGMALPTSGWKAYASNSDPSSPPNAVFDGNVEVGWQSGIAQSPGIWFLLDMGQPQLFFGVDSVVVQAPDEAALSFDLLGSLDGQTFVRLQGDVIAGEMTAARFDQAQYFRYLKFVLTQSKPQWWSIGELWVRR